MTVFPLGDSAVMIELGEGEEPATLARVRAVTAAIERSSIAGVTDVVPAFSSVGVFFDGAPAEAFAAMRERLEAIVAEAGAGEAGMAERTVEVPVRYGGEAGPDLAEVAARAGMSPEAVIAAHAGAEYRVRAVGFAPGFPYLEGLPVALHTPRRATPRAMVPAGSVGIGGAQAGVYPLATPGGWNLIGRTPMALFDAGRAEPAALRVGDRVRFREIGEAEWERLGKVGRGEPAVGEAVSVEGGGVRVARAGMWTTVQDLGRTGHRARGVPLSGAADTVALRVANLIVGNDEGAAGLEYTRVGPELEFESDTVVAIGGGRVEGLPCWCPIEVRRGTRLRIGALREGCRGYLAVAGGIAVTPVLGSRATYTRAGLGGLAGRVLRDGDRLATGRARARRGSGRWRIDERILPEYGKTPVVARVVAAAQTAEFDASWLDAEFTVTERSDRMGARLRGPEMARRSARELWSGPVAPGTVQVPPDGQPIVLLADAQTIGGYPQAGGVISADLPLVAQLRPGDRVRFAMVSLEEAREVAVARERALGLLREGVGEKWA